MLSVQRSGSILDFLKNVWFTSAAGSRVSQGPPGPPGPPGAPGLGIGSVHEIQQHVADYLQSEYPKEFCLASASDASVMGCPLAASAASASGDNWENVGQSGACVPLECRMRMADLWSGGNGGCYVP